MQLHIQYLTNSTGATTAVQIPFKEWTKLTNDYTQLQQYSKMKTSLSAAFNEMAEIEKSHKNAVTLQEFLNES
ncbi:MAG: hypothetical protein L3J71_07230 [Victivallaceae bacterium]|nr:hypothetical protein [Victivallaceae bacterium]